MNESAERKDTAIFLREKIYSLSPKIKPLFDGQTVYKNKTINFVTCLRYEFLHKCIHYITLLFLYCMIRVTYSPPFHVCPTVFIASTSTPLFSSQRSHLITLVSLLPLLPCQACRVAIVTTLCVVSILTHSPLRRLAALFSSPY